MDIEDIREHCLAKAGVSEDFPFDESTLAFRVVGKIFALTGLENVPLRINLKCDPERALDLRERHESVAPGYHMNKKHWNTVSLEGDVGSALLRDLIDHSYELVRRSLKKSERQELDRLDAEGRA